MITEEVLVARVASWDHETAEEFESILAVDFDQNVWLENEETIALCIDGITYLRRGAKVIKLGDCFEVVILEAETAEEVIESLRWQEFYEEAPA